MQVNNNIYIKYSENTRALFHASSIWGHLEESYSKSKFCSWILTIFSALEEILMKSKSYFFVWYFFQLRRDDTFGAKIQENETSIHMLFLYCHSIDITDTLNKVYIFIEAKRALHSFPAAEKNEAMCANAMSIWVRQIVTPRWVGVSRCIEIHFLDHVMDVHFNPFLSSTDQLLKKAVSDFQYHALYWNGTSSRRSYD